MKLLNLLLENGSAMKKAKEIFLDEIVKNYHLTTIELTVLLFLKTSEFDTAKDITNELFIAKSHVSLSVNLLNKKGYIQKIQDKENRKITHLKLTEKSDEICRIANLKINELEDKLFNELTNEDKKYMEKIFNIFYKNVKGVIEGENI